MLLEDQAGVVATDLAGDDICDVAAAPAGPGDGVHQGEGFFGQGDVRPDKGHRVPPSV